MRRSSKWLLILLAVVALASFLPIIKAAITHIPTGTWVPAGNGSSAMSSARSGAAAVQLHDGRILITGGSNGVNSVSTADIFDMGGNFSAAPAMQFARSRHTATVLTDGTVLVAGGLDSNGVPTNTAEIFDPSNGSWTHASSMAEARSGHTATVLADGTVLIAGGYTGNQATSTFEIYAPSTGQFIPASGTLSSARENHAAVRLQDGRVLLVGGWDGTYSAAQPPSSGSTPNVVGTSDIFDPATGTVSQGPTLNAARMGHTATLQLDGKIFVVGGSNGTQDLASAEVFDPAASTGFTMVAVALTTPRSNHLAFLLPHNGGTMIVGGTSAGTAIASAEIYMPVYLSQAETATLTPAPTPMSTARVFAAGSPLSDGTVTSANDGLLLVVGGTDAAGNALTSSEMYGFQWMKTDALDYSPGMPVTITGGGFQPGETVTLHFEETPYYDSHPDLTAVVQADGSFTNSEFAPDIHDIDVRFFLTATGSQSGLQAQITFTDNKNVTVAFAGTGSGSVTSSPAGINCADTHGTGSGSCTVSVGNAAQVTLTATATVPSAIGTWNVPAYTINSGCTTGSATCTFTLDNSSQTVTLTINPGPVSGTTSTVTANPASVVANGTSTSTVTVTLKDSGGSVVAGKTVSLTPGSGSSIVTAVNATTDTSGQATFTVKDSAVESITYTAKHTTDNTTVVQTTTVNFTVGAVSASASTVIANPTMVVADGSTASTVTVTLLDAFNHPVSGKSVTLSQGAGHSTISPANATTNSSGIATFLVKDTKAEAVTFTATDTTDSVTVTQTAQVTFTVGTVSATVSTVSSAPTSVPADNSTTSTITVTLLDANSNPVSGKAVSLIAGSGASTISPASATSNSSGVAIFTVKDATVESVIYTAKDTTDNITITPTATVSFTVGPVSASTSTVTSNPTSIVADGVTTSTITVTLLDASSRPVSGKAVTLTQGAGSSTITTANGTTNPSGQATFTLKDTKAETVTYTAKDSTDNITVTQTAQVTFTPGTPTAGNSTVTTNPTSITADGSTTSTITVTLQDAHNNPVSGKTVTLSQGGGSSTIATVNGTTNASGVATFTVKDTKAEVVTYTATDATDAVIVSQTAQVTFTPGPVAKFVFSAIASPQTAGTAFNVTITAQDANGNTAKSYDANGNNVTITSTGTLSGGTITTASFTNGVLANQPITITNIGNFTLTATGNPGHANGIIGTSNSFTVNPGAATHFTVSAPPSATAGTPISATVTALDAFGNTATGYSGTVHFGSSDSQASLPANYVFQSADNGVHSFSVTLKTAGSQTVTSADTTNGGIAGTSGNISVSAAAAASVAATAGTPQSAGINSVFSTNLGTTVKDAFGNPVSGSVVTFTAPANGASGTFAGGVNTATSNSSGIATAAVFTANGIGGTYDVTASAAGVATPAHFTLTNNNPAPTLSVVNPTSGILTQTLNVTLTGTNFLIGVTSVSFGADISVNSVTVNSASQITASITIPSTATLGGHAVSVTNPGPGGGTASLPNAFNVTGTPPAITSSNGATFTAGSAGTFVVTATGTPTPSFSKTGNLPAGVNFTDNGNGTATIAGTTNTAGSFPILITAQNGISPNASQNFILVVNPAPLASIVLNPASTSITAGGSAAFNATGYDQYGNSRGDVTGATTFSVTGGTCTGNQCGGTVAGVQTVTGNDSGISNTATLTVLPGAITHLLLSPSPSTIAAGASQTYTAVGLDFYNNSAGDVTGSTTFTIASDGSCTGPNCTAKIADTNGSTHTVTGVYSGNGAQGQASLTVTAGSFSQLQILVPGETAAPGTAIGKTGTPSLEYVNGQFQATVNAVDRYWNVVTSVNDAIQIASNDASAALPTNDTLTAGMGAFNVTLATVSYNPATTTLTATDSATASIAPGTSALIPVIIVYTAAITPTDWATGQQANYTLTLSNAGAPNTNILSSVEIAVPQNDQNSIGNVSIIASNQGNVPVNWSYDATMQPGIMRLHANSASDAVVPGGNITVTFTATSNVSITSNPVSETWNTVAFSDIVSKNSLPLASPEPFVNIGAAPQITSASSTSAFTYETSGTTFTVTTTGVPTASISISGSFPTWARFTDNHTGTATISGTPTAAGTFTFTITAQNGYGNDATQSFTLNVNKALVTPSITAADKTYDGLATAVVTCKLSGIIGNDDVSCSAASASFAQAGAGKNIAVNATGISLSGAAAANYQLSAMTASTTANIDPKQVTASITASDKPYDSTTAATIQCKLAGVLSQDLGNVSCAAASANFSQAAAGNNLAVNATGISLSGPAATNYLLSSDSASTTANITQKTVIPSISATDKVYDTTTTASVTCGLSGVVGNDNVSCAATAANFSSANAGSWQVTATGIILGGAASANYQLSTTTANATARITPATPAILVGGGPFTYDAMPHSASATATGVGGVLVTGSVIFTYTPPGDTTTPVNAGTYTVNAMFTSADTNYNNASGSGSIVINKAQATVSAADASRSYGQPNPTFTGTLTGFIAADGISATYASAATVGTAVGIYGPTSTYAVVPTLVDPSNRLANYSVTSTNGTLTINVVPLLVISPDNTRPFGSADAPLTPTLAGLVAGDTAASVGNPMCSASATSSSAPGSYAIVCSGANSNNYVVTYVNGTLTVSDPLSSISVNPNPATVTYGESTTLTAQGTFASSTARNLANAGGEAYNLHDLAMARTGAAAAEAQGKLYLIGGLVSGSPSNTVEAYDPASDSWTPVANLNTARTSARAASVAGKVYVFGGCSDAACTALVATSEVYDPATNSWSGISASGFTPRRNTAVAVVTDKVYVAGGKDSSGNPVSTVEVYDPGTNSWSSSAPLVKALDPASGVIVNGNLYVIGISGGNAEVEEFSSGAWSTVNTGTQPLSDVSAAVLNNVIYVMDGGSVHAYDPSTNAWTDKTGLNSARLQPQIVTIANLIYIAGNTASGVANQNALEAFASDEAGWSSTVAAVSSVDQNGKALALKVGNTTITATSIQMPSISGNTSLTVNPATLTVKADAQTKVYGQSDPALTYSATGFQFTDTQSAVLTGGLTRDAGENVIPSPGYSITRGSLAANDNYTISYTGNYLVITPATLTVTADQQTKIYGQSDPALTYQVVGLQFSDSAGTVLTGSLTRSPGESVAGSPYAISQGTLKSNNNYTTSFTGNHLTITPATLTVKADPQAKIYGQRDPALTYQVTGLQFNEPATAVLTGMLTRAQGEAVAGSPYVISQGTLAANSNYTISFIGSSLGITPAALTVMVASQMKVYGQPDPELTYSVSGFKFTDTAATVLAGKLARAAGENVAGSPYTITQGTLAANSNYTITFIGNSLSITPAPLIITADPKTKTYGQGDPALTYQVAGLQLTDMASSVLAGGLTRAPGENVVGSPYPIAQGTLAANSNYSIVFTSAVLTITPATLTITADAKTKIYGQADPALSYAASGFQFSDSISTVLTGSMARVAGENVNDSPGYAIGRGSLAANGNYTISFTGSALTITPATLTITANTISKVYGQTDPALTYKVVGLQFTDTAASVLSGGLVRSPGEDVNTYPISQGSLVTNSNYTISFTGNVMTVTPAPLTVTASSGGMIFGSAPFIVTPMYNGFVNSEGPSNLPVAPACGPAFSNTTFAGSYGTNCTGPAFDGNYGLTYIGGNLIVSPANTQTTVSPSLNPSTFMQLVTFTAVVANTSNGSSVVPAGTVTFNNTYNGATTAICSNVTLGVVNGQDQATCSTTTLGDMYPNNVTASFSPNPVNFNPSSSGVLQQVVNPAPAVTLSPLSISFGNTNVGSTSSPATVTLGNAGDALLSLGAGAITITGPNASDFTFTTTCGSGLGYPPGASTCKINVLFKPTETGVETATLQITDNDDNASGAQQFVSLTGSGLSTISGTSLYTNAIFGTSNACGAITVSGGSWIDSFNSILGYSASKQNTGGNVGTNGNVTLNGSNSAIYGSAAVDSTSTGSCSKSSVPGLTSNGGAKVTGGLIPLNGPITYPAPPSPNPVPPITNQSISGSCPSGMAGCTNSGSKMVTLSSGQYGNVSVSGGTTVHISRGTYNLNSLILSGKSIVTIDSGPVVMNIAGASLNNGSPAIDLSGGSIVNPSHIPANLQFAYGGSHGVNLTGGADSYAVLYAPNALVNMSGGTDFFGSIIGSAVTSSGGTAVHYDANLPNIQSGNYIWFSAVANNLNGLPTNQQVKLYLTNATVSFTANGTQYNNLPVPNGVITFNSSSQPSGAKTIFDTMTGRWSTNVAKNGATGNTFVTGFAFPVPANFPSGIQNVTFSAAFSTDTPGITLQWQWNAAVYTQFSTTYAMTGNNNALGVNAEDGTANANGTDLAGTPEAYKQYATFGATGGYFSSASGIVPTVAQVSASPSSLDFGPQTVGQQSNSQQVVLTNNYSTALSISGIAIAGGDAGDFKETDTCSRNTGGFAAGTSCTITVTFAPSYSNFEAAKIVITDTANNSPQTIYLSGTGQ